MEKIRMGEVQKLKVVREKEFGVYLGFEDDESAVLLPKKEVTGEMKIGDSVEAFIYRDSEDRPIATLRTPRVTVGKFGYLPVKALTKIGAFLDFGIEKELFLPFREQEGPLKVGQRVLIYMYLDKSKRLAATMKVYDRLTPTQQFQKGNSLQGIVYRISPDVGAMIAVLPHPEMVSASMDELHFGLIPKQSLFEKLTVGDLITVRISRVREDGKLDLTTREKAKDQIEADARKVLDLIHQYDGILPFSESASPEVIQEELAMSKSSFKRALGHLLKKRMIQILDTEVHLLK